MKLIIDIPEEAYNLLKTSGVDWLGATHILDAVSKGISLPQGHGRLLILDEGSVEKYMFPMSFSCQKWISEVGISNSVVTIIDSDKEEKQNEVT